VNEKKGYIICRGGDWPVERKGQPKWLQKRFEPGESSTSWEGDGKEQIFFCVLSGQRDAPNLRGMGVKIHRRKEFPDRRSRMMKKGTIRRR